MKLTKGTRVRLTSDVDALRRGAVGVVLEDYSRFDGQVDVSWDYFSSGWGDGNSGWGVYARNLEVVEPWMPKEGDEVVITKSSKNWNEAMDKFNGRRVAVTRVHYVNTVGTCIAFADDGGWNWSLEWGHFKKAPANTSRSTSGEVVSSEDDLFIMTNSGVKLRAGDIVVITRGTKAWNSDMERLVGKVVKISKIVPSEFGSQSHRIIFKEGGSWEWSYGCGHFVSCDEHINRDGFNYKIKDAYNDSINFFNEKNKSVVTQKEIEKLTEIQTFKF